MKKLFVALMMTIMIADSNMAGTEAAEVDHRSWTVVQVTYKVQKGDTLDSVAKQYIQKNTYGARDINEFKEGIRELNEWLLGRDMIAGDVLRINYWEEVKK